MKVCPICGKKFLDARKSSHEKVYCSSKCQRRGVSIRAAVRKKAARHAARKMKVCPECGNEFMQTSAHKVYCSKRCGNKASHRSERNRRLAANFGDFNLAREITRAKAERAAKAASSAWKHRDMMARVRAYLDLPASERWARRNELTKDERKLAERLFNQRGAV